VDQDGVVGAVKQDTKGFGNLDVRMSENREMITVIKIEKSQQYYRQW
jgi:hypothetical protein